MCFILAIIGKDGLSPALLQQTPGLLRMTQARGPDGTNSAVVSDQVFLGSNRLSIIDVSQRGQMPMKSLAGDYWIVYNGELYNHDDLREQLVAGGIRFRSRSDTEVVVNAYVHWGVEFVEKLNGIFAFVIFDKQRGRVVTGRDRFGAKPLHYTEIDGHVIFSSEYRVIQQMRNAQPSISVTSSAGIRRCFARSDRGARARPGAPSASYAANHLCAVRSGTAAAAAVRVSGPHRTRAARAPTSATRGRYPRSAPPAPAHYAK